MPILIEPGTALLYLLIVILLRQSPDIIAYVHRHWTTVGSISSEIESLHKMSGDIDRIIAYQHRVPYPPLSQESQTTLAGLRCSWTKWVLSLPSRKFLPRMLMYRLQDHRLDAVATQKVHRFLVPFLAISGGPKGPRQCLQKTRASECRGRCR